MALADPASALMAAGSVDSFDSASDRHWAGSFRQSAVRPDVQNRLSRLRENAGKTTGQRSKKGQPD